SGVASQADDTVLRCGIAGLVTNAEDPTDRCGVHDRTVTLFVHLLQNILHAEEDAVEVDGHNFRELIKTEFFGEGLFALDRKSVEEAVDLTESRRSEECRVGREGKLRS